MSDFLETPRFPTSIGLGSKGGPEYSTSIVKSKSGYEFRNINWTYPLHRFNVAYGVKTYSQLEELLEYFHVCGGRAYGFRFKHHIDFKSCAYDSTISSTDTIIGTGDASENQFQLYKRYTKGSFTKDRKILKPVSSVGVLINLSSKGDLTEGVHFDVDYTTGIVTIDDSSSIPGAGEIVRAGFEFDIPMRFDIDFLDISLNDLEAGFADIPIYELRETN